MHFYSRVCRLVFVLLAMAGGGVFAQNTVAAGATAYTVTKAFTNVTTTLVCSACHFTSAPPTVGTASTAHRAGSNNTAGLIAAFSTGGMRGNAGVPAGGATLTATEALRLALYIGQYKVPAPTSIAVGSALEVASGGTRTVNLYSQLPTNGSSGVAQDAVSGVTTSGPVGGTTGAIARVTTLAPAYNVTFTANANSAGAASFNFAITNPAGTGNGTINLNVIGINGAAFPVLSAGVAMSSVQLSVNGTASGNYSITVGALPTNVTMSPGGLISGTPAIGAAGSYTFTVSRAMTANGSGFTATRQFTLDVKGLSGTSLNTLNLTQDQAMTPFTISAYLTPNGTNIATGLPPGLTIGAVFPNVGKIIGTPTTSGTFISQLTVPTTIGTVVQNMTIDVASAGAPAITTSPVLSAVVGSPTVIGTVGSPISSVSNIQINASRPSNVTPTYTLTPNPLSTGITVNATSGLISGTPQQSGDFPITLTGNWNDLGGQGSLLRTVRINPNAPPLFTSAASVTQTVAQTLSHPLAATNPVNTFTLAPSSAALPSGMSINPTTGVVSAAANSLASGVYLLRFRATNAFSFSEQDVTFNINPVVVPVITTPTVAGVTLASGQAMSSLQMVATNPPILGFAVNGGSSLPAGLLLSPSGLITGTPTTPGIVNTVFVANNAAGLGPTLQVPFTIDGITSGGSIGATQGVVMSSYQITTPLNNASSYALASGSLPAGVTLSAGGLIAGTPTVSGSFPITVQAVTPSGTYTKVVSFAVASAGVPVISSNPVLPVSPAVAGTVGNAFTSTQIVASNPPITAGSYTATGLPSGISVDINSGIISGNPSQSGDFTVTLGASNSSGASTASSFLMRISPNLPPVISALTGPQTTGTVNQTFTNVQLVASNPVITSYSVFSGALPPGLSLGATSGIISGTPTQSGLFNATLRASNAAGNGDLAVAFTINPNAVPVISAPGATTLASGVALGAPLQLVASNPLISAYAVANTSSLPAGLNLNTANGQITGTPSTPGIVSTSFTATNTAGTGPGFAVNFTIDGITSGGSIAATQGVVMSSYQITTPLNNASNYSLASGSLPAGVTLSAGGLIAGTPTVSGSFPITVQAVTPSGTYTKAVSFTVASAGAPVITSTPTLSTNAAAPTVIGTQGTAISNIQIDATNPPITAGSYIASGLPTGLSVNINTGLISGTPSQAGDFTVTLGANNGSGAGTRVVQVRVNSNLAPVITSSAAASTVQVGNFGTPYQIVATNGPITGYALAAGSLPPGLTLNTSNGSVSGTPTQSGLFNVTFRATNTAGLAGQLSVAFSVAAVNAPVISSPTFVALAVGVSMKPVQIVSTNAPILNFGVDPDAGLPVGLAVDPVTGIISGTPTVPGLVNTTLLVTNAAGVGLLSVPFTVGLPNPAACTLNVPLNTAGALDIKGCMFPGFAPTGVSVLATPSHGSVTVSGTVVTYMPSNNYFGPDSFSAVGHFSGGGITVAGIVKVLVTGRPDPARDPVVGAIVGAQAETLQAFSRAQVSNFQRRMESLHQRSGTNSPAPQLRQNGSSTEPKALSTPSPGVSGRSNFEAVRDAAISISGPAPVVMSQTQAFDAIATGTGLKSLPFAEAVTSLLTTNSVNMASLLPSKALPSPEATSFWVEGVASFGKKDATANGGGYEFSTSGISVGADRRINEKLVMGLGVGMGRDKTIIGTDGSQNDGRGTSLSVYGSYQPTPSTYVDAMVGFGGVEFDTQRYVLPINGFAIGNRRGTQMFGSLTGGYEYRRNGLSISPYGRVDYSADKLLDSTETGAGAYALAFFDQTSTSLQGTLGVRAESIHETSFGWAIPRLRAEYRHEFQSDRQGFISYADQIGGPRYGLTVLGAGRDALLVGIGSDFVMRDGWTLGLDYQLSQTSGRESSHALQFKLTKLLDAKGLPRLIGDYVDEVSKPVDVQLDASYSFDDNVTRAKSGPDVQSDTVYAVNVSKSESYSLTENSRFLLTGTVGGERFQNFNGLSRISVGLEGELQYRESSEFDAPTYSLFGKASAERYGSDLRNGFRTSFGASVRQPLTDRITLVGALSQNRRIGTSAVFNTVETALKLNADYLLSERETLYLTNEFRYGDIVSTGRPSLENVSIAKVFVQDDAYPGGQLFSYRFDGRTVLTTLGYNIGFGPRDSFDISWRRVQSTPGMRPSFVTSPESYITNQLAVTYLLRF